MYNGKRIPYLGLNRIENVLNWTDELERKGPVNIFIDKKHLKNFDPINTKSDYCDLQFKKYEKRELKIASEDVFVTFQTHRVWERRFRLRNGRTFK